MNVARRSEGLLPAEGFVALWRLAAGSTLDRAAIAEVIAARGVGTPSRTHNSIILMEEMGLIRDANGHVEVIKDALPAADVHDGMRQAVLAHYCRLLRTVTLGQVFQHDLETGDLQVDRVLLPFRGIGLPYLLIEFGLVVRADGRALLVAPDAVTAFFSVLAEINGRALRSRPMTPAQLEAWLAARRAAGEIAEAFAMEFECRRLDGHPMLEQVRWVSTEDVGAGFDILSFEDQRSLLLDRSIEVKGYSGKRAFHWSREEIAAARLRREKHWLYLVDRDRVHEEGYSPEMLNDPYTYLIEVNPAGWRHEATSYHFSAPLPLAGQ